MPRWQLIHVQKVDKSKPVEELYESIVLMFSLILPTENKI